MVSYPLAVASLGNEETPPELPVVKPINLNKARKARAKAAAKVKAAQNRALFGLGKAQKTVSQLEAERARRALDHAKRDD